jgi:hypothetical protein
MRPYLIQRLQKPTGMLNPFSFGGGLVNGGLSPEATSLLKGIWQYDYMGSAEFEWGAVPESLKTIASYSKDFTTGKVKVVGSFKDYSGTISVVKKEERDIFFACRERQMEEVIQCIQLLANDVKHDYRTKERVGLAQAICNKDERTCGWHDIDNDFLFFTDEKMFLEFTKLFGLKEAIKV